MPNQKGIDDWCEEVKIMKKTGFLIYTGSPAEWLMHLSDTDLITMKIISFSSSHLKLVLTT